MRVKEVMTQDVVTVTPSTPLKEASTRFLKHRISGMPVVERGRVVGVLSESDIVAKETSGYSNGEVSRAEASHLRRERAAETVRQAMTPRPVTAEPWFPIWAAADLMAVNDVNRLPVVDGRGSLVGIVTRDDLVRAFARSDGAVERDIRENLLPSIDLTPSALDVTVARGVVTVRGEIDSHLASECLRNTIHLVPGVVEVDWQVETPTAAA
ncbi:MAG TPA: CBS domain-containing protein [Gaiellaceae bacterium]|nr:CBS domain-containing protein [Gaiellaceae bacterium]